MTRTWDDQRLKRDRLALLQEEMRARGIGALYLEEEVHRRYALNLNVPGGNVFVPAEGHALAIVRERDIGWVQLSHANVRLRSARGAGRGNEDGGNAFAAGIAELMREHEVAGEHLAVDRLRAKTFSDLMAAGIPLVDAEPIVERAWSVKTEDEIVIYRAIGGQYAQTVRAFREAIRPGVSEIELAAVAISAWHCAGGEDIAQLNVCSGENMNPWRRWPSERKLEAGDFVGIDLHGRGFNGLRGDASRTFLVGEHPTVEQRDLYRRAFEYMRGAIGAMRAGRSIEEATALVPKVPEEYRVLMENYNIAHGIGMGASGYPQLDPRRPPIKDVLKPNQVLAVECYFAEEGNPLAVKLEEQIVVRDGEPEVLGIDMPYDERFV